MSPTAPGAAAQPVWHLITTLELGGAQEHTLHVVRSLPAARYATRLLVGPGGQLHDEAAYALGSRLELVPELQRAVDVRRDAAALLRLTRRLRAAVRALPGLILHTHSSKAGILGRAAAAFAGVPIVVHSIHGYGFNDRQPAPVRAFYQRLERLAARATTHFVAVSSVDINSGLEQGLFTPERVTLIRSGFDLAAFRRDERAGAHLRRVLGVPPHAPVAGTVANFKPQKAPLDFVAAMLQVAVELRGAHVIYAGDGELRPQAEARVRAAGLSDRFHFIGWRRDVARVLSALDVFVLASHWEGLPKVVPQAMCAGLPVVATCVGGTPEVIDHGRTGFLVQAGDVAELARRTLHLLRNAKAARAMGAHGATRVADFDQVLLVERHERLYERLLDEQAARGPVAAPGGRGW